MTPDGPDELVARWKEEARLFRRRGQPALEAMATSYAADLESWWAAYQGERLTLTQAAAESGYTADALSRKVKRGEIKNVGRPGAPKLRRCDLPRKVAKARERDTEPQLAAVVLAARERA